MQDVLGCGAPLRMNNPRLVRFRAAHRDKVADLDKSWTNGVHENEHGSQVADI